MNWRLKALNNADRNKYEKGYDRIFKKKKKKKHGKKKE